MLIAVATSRLSDVECAALDDKSRMQIPLAT